jgi:hypothetical protein
MANGTLPKQVFSMSWGSGSWEVTVDGESVGVFEGSWSGEVEREVQVKRVDTEHADRTG